MVLKYRLYNSGIFLYEGSCSHSEFELIKNKFNFGAYFIEVLN